MADIFASIKKNEVDSTKYPLLTRFGSIMGQDVVKVIGREDEMHALRVNLSRPATNNALLLGPAGVGKTALVETFAAYHAADDEVVFEIDIVAMAEDGQAKFSAMLKKLIDEVQSYAKQTGVRPILFVDETHVLVINGATDAIKPALARGIFRLIGATTDEEYIDFIKQNVALDRRFQQIQITPPSDIVTQQILRQLANKYAADVRISDLVLRRIVEYGRYQPALAQPAKSIDLLYGMIGEHRVSNVRMNVALLNQVLKRKTGVDAKWSVDVDATLEYLRSRVFGQEGAISVLKNRLYIANAQLQDESRPMGSFIFAGTTGVGKTEITKALAYALFGTEEAMTRFDMSEYSTQETVSLFQERVSTALMTRPYTILLFDELEKGHPGTRDLMLQLLDDGRLSDKYGRQISALNAYIIATTNKGSGTLKDMAWSGLDVHYYQRLLESDLGTGEDVGQALRPEFLGRFDEIVPFAPLTAQVKNDIAYLYLEKLANRLLSRRKISLTLDARESNVKLRLNPEDPLEEPEVVKVNRVVDYLVRNNVTIDPNSGGARMLKRRIDSEVTAVISREIAKASSRGVKLKTVQLKVVGTMVADDQNTSKGDARIEVDVA